MTDQVPTSANQFVEQQLDARLEALEDEYGADCLCIVGPIVSGLDDLLRTVVEGRREVPDSKDHLVVFLTTSGGYIETVQRMVETIRHHYSRVDFVIPNFAFSAGTVFAMSGDDIYMNYYSRLGPIDPQVRSANGRSVPALGYLEQYQRLVVKSQKGTISPAEMIVMSNFDQAELYQYEQARELSVSLLKEWLASYKFKNWKVTEDRKMKVTDKIRSERAVSIARKLNQTGIWHSHGHGISMEVLKKKLKLKILDLENPDECKVGIHSLIRQYDGLLSDYMSTSQKGGIVHVVGRFVPYRAG